MRCRRHWALACGFVLLMALGYARAAAAQSQPWRSAEPQQPAAAVPEEQNPQRLPTPPAAPFQLSAAEQAQLDSALQFWEQRSAEVRVYEAKFRRWVYSSFGGNGEPIHVDDGSIYFEAPEKARFHVHSPKDRQEQWITDGQAVFHFDYRASILREYPLPPELRGQSIADGPLPFVFGAEAAALKQRYFLRLITPPDAKEQVWIEAFPRFQEDAANFARAEIVLSTRDWLPWGVHIYLPGDAQQGPGGNRHAYQFYEAKVNPPLGFLRGNPFRVATPLGWRRIVEQPEPQTTQRPATPERR